MKTTINKTNVNYDIQFLEGILNHVKDPLVVKDDNHNFILLNDASCQFFGYPREQMIGKTDSDFFPEEEAAIFLKKDLEVFRTGQPNINIEKITDSHGNTFVISTKKSLYKTPSGKSVIVIIIRDITDLKMTEKHLLHSVDKLAEFVYSASHDLKSPLTTINSFVKLIQKDSEGLSEKVKSYFGYISSASETASNLVTKLLEYATTNNEKHESVTVNLNEIIDEVKSNIRSSIVDNNVKFELAKLPTVKANKVRMYQLFQNINLFFEIAF